MLEFNCGKCGSIFTRVFVALMAASVWTTSVHAQSQDVTIQVTDPEGTPLRGAEVEIFEYYSSLKPTQFQGETDELGEIQFQGVDLDGYAYLVARHVDFAPAIHFLSIAGQDKVTTRIRMAPAMKTFVNIRSPDGKPLAGAEVTRLEFSSKLTGERHFANHDFFMAMMGNDGSPYQSDAQGRLHLPPLPADAVLSISVTHPKFAVGDIKDIETSSLANSTIALREGTTIEAYLVGPREVVQKLEGKRLDLRTSDRNKERLMHSLPLQNGKLEFSLIPSRYDSLYISGGEDLVITPSLPSSSRLAEFANIPDQETVLKKFVVRELHSVKGRVVTAAGKPVGGLELWANYDNLYIDEEGEQQVVEEHPTASEFMTTNSNGEFECRLPKGNVSISANWDSGYYSIPQEFKFVFEDQLELPDVVVKPMPTLQGVAVDEAGKPVPNAVIRLVDHTDDYVFADQEGRFEVPVSALDYDHEEESMSSFKSVSAFDLGSALCCIETIDITNDQANADLRLTLKPHPADWLLNRLQEISEKQNQRMLDSSNYMQEKIEQYKKRREEMIAKYPFAPDLAEGTWLKGMGSQSLSEFRGKYVLLDFWFIGCGPCERELPNLKLAHQKFKNRNFEVIGIHIAGQGGELVEQYMEKRNIAYPMIIDRFDEPIKTAYQPLGLQGYPTYFLIDPDGKIDWDAPMRGKILETVRDRILKLEASKSVSEN